MPPLKNAQISSETNLQYSKALLREKKSRIIIQMS